jgi:hypothetical protein
MERTGYLYEIKVTLEFGRAEVDHLLQLARAHYDPRCNAAAEPGPRGILNGLANSVVDGRGTFTFAVDELATLVKICELEAHMPRTIRLFLPLSQVLREACDHSMRINECNG